MSNWPRFARCLYENSQSFFDSLFDKPIGVFNWRMVCFCATIYIKRWLNGSVRTPQHQPAGFALVQAISGKMGQFLLTSIVLVWLHWLTNGWLIIFDLGVSFPSIFPLVSKDTDESFFSDGSQRTKKLRERFFAVERIGSLRKIAAWTANGPEFRNGSMQL